MLSRCATLNDQVQPPPSGKDSPTPVDGMAQIDKKAGVASVSANSLRTLVKQLFSWSIEKHISKVSPTAGIKKAAKRTWRDDVLTNDKLKGF